MEASVDERLRDSQSKAKIDGHHAAKSDESAVGTAAVAVENAGGGEGETKRLLIRVSYHQHDFPACQIVIVPLLTLLTAGRGQRPASLSRR